MGIMVIKHLKNSAMKKIFVFILLSITVGSCYDGYIYDFEFDAVYFAHPIDVRTFIIGEGMKIEVGVALGGVRENTIDRNVNFNIDPALITDEILASMKVADDYIKAATLSVTSLLPLPSNYYTMSNSNTMIIKKGQHMGSIVIKADSTAFLDDPVTIISTYALPFYITGADADSILATNRSAIIGVKYENMLFGNYWHGGVTLVKDPSGTLVDTILYYTQIPVPESKIWKLTTVAPNKLVTNGYSDQTSSKNEMTLTFDGNDISVSNAIGSTLTIEPDGQSSYNKAKLLQNRKIILSYKYINAEGNTCYAQDTLTFRNRINDGVNEWQDTDPSHY
jgi:hypothetical protein